MVMLQLERSRRTKRPSLLCMRRSYETRRLWPGDCEMSVFMRLMVLLLNNEPWMMLNERRPSITEIFKSNRCPR